MTTIKIGLGRDKISAPNLIDIFRLMEKGDRNLDHRHVDLTAAESRTKKTTDYIRGGVKIFMRLRDAVTEPLEEEHPYIVAIVVSGVVQAVVSPWVLQALGSGQLGPVAGEFFSRPPLRILYLKVNSDAVPTQGSFAAGLQAPIGAAVATASLFSILQWVGMT
ncbi:hypothetical protein CNYM01_04761 [Colletotrichum nymphaeae SA-01]|uniref:Uncharacterized protein n=1 Tax=Colletotrichum nymphaeae SA-01 TaxID=1460502 RepID=A0A135T5A0_9PEZI|nr:hypothetical protein CNYM01_04761 [Colletotrichum nymphaeae SA-01]